MNRRDDLANAVGLDNDVGIVTRMMFRKDDEEEGDDNEDSGPRLFVCIVGESGAGKNTLAKIIHDQTQMRRRKEVIVWHNMVAGSSTEDLLSILYRSASLQCGEFYDPELVDASNYVGEKLRGVLAFSTYLLILGGISSQNTLNSLRASLPDRYEKGCVLLILDTENEDVAWHANTMNSGGISGVHFLTRLDQGRSAQLFFWKVLRKGQYGSESSPEYKEYSRLVYNITGGHPMAIVLLAGLLRFKEKPLQWDAVLQLLSSDFSRDSEEGASARQRPRPSGTRRALEIIFWECFEDLSNELKSCFLHLASYPNNSCYVADTVVRMWIAEGFINWRHGKTPEEVGHDYVKELVLRCLVQVDDMKPGGGIHIISVHSSLKGFMRSEVTEAGFMYIHDAYDVLVPPSVRRLCVQSDQGKRYTTNHKLPKLRSFICYNMEIGDTRRPLLDLNFLCGSKFIRVIAVRRMSIHQLPDQIGNMIQLRYLRIDSTSLRHIPASIAKLLNLQTLDITSTQVQEIVPDFWKIKTLRHVLADKLMLPVTVIAEGDCTELQTLHGVRPMASQEWSKDNCPLRNMTNIRSLEMHGFEHAHHALEDALANMPLLGHLNLQGDELPSCVFSNPRLRSLQTIVLHGEVKWDDVILQLPEIRRPLNVIRPNLAQLRLNGDALTGMPQSIKDLLDILI